MRISWCVIPRNKTINQKKKLQDTKLCKTLKQFINSPPISRRTAKSHLQPLLKRNKKEHYIFLFKNDFKKIVKKSTAAEKSMYISFSIITKWQTATETYRNTEETTIVYTFTNDSNQLKEENNQSILMWTLTTWQLQKKPRNLANHFQAKANHQ